MSLIVEPRVSTQRWADILALLRRFDRLVTHARRLGGEVPEEVERLLADVSTACEQETNRLSIESMQQYVRTRPPGVAEMGCTVAELTAPTPPAYAWDTLTVEQLVTIYHGWKREGRKRSLQDKQACLQALVDRAGSVEAAAAALGVATRPFQHRCWELNVKMPRKAYTRRGGRPS